MHPATARTRGRGSRRLVPERRATWGDALPPVLGSLIVSAASAAPAVAGDLAVLCRHRRVIERTFPPRVFDGLDGVAKAKVNANNAALGVRWVTSYANAELTRTWCIYEEPSAQAVIAAAAANSIPADRVTEVPVGLLP